MAKRQITDRTLETLKAAPSGERIEIKDSIVPGLRVRVTDKGAKTFVLRTRYPGGEHAVRRALGTVGALSLKDARKKARHWLELISQGKDPAAEEEKQRQAALRERNNTFGVVIEEYLTRHVKGQRRAGQVEREIRGELIPVWEDKPVTEITKADVVALVEGIKDRGAPYQAHNVFGHIRTFFNWTINRGIYGLPEASPCDRLKPGKLIGPKKPRQRVLSDDELRAFWRASGRLGYPFGPMFRLMMVTGQRRSEVSDAQWPEFHPDLVGLIRKHAEEDEPIDWARVPADIKLWTVPPERFKSDSPHLVPLSDDACAILATLPRFKKGNHLFSTTFGEKPVSGFSKAKKRLDRRMLLTLKATARRRGESPKNMKLERFVNHDDRRTMRTRLSSLRVPENVAEMIVGHGKKGLARVYDQHAYVNEMREGLEAWAGRLRSIVNPPLANVVTLRQSA